MLKTLPESKWQGIGMKKRAGLLVPLFSLYSRQSLGAGDLEDLKLIVDWAKDTGNSIIQLLPMNELGAVFCPYDSLSSFALEPFYLCLRALAPSRNKTVAKKIEGLKKQFPAGKPRVDYRLKSEKLFVLWEIYKAENNLQLPEFIKFTQDNKYWLDDFAFFKVVKNCQGQRPWYEWEEKYRLRDRQALDEFYKAHAQEIDFQKWLQWVIYWQFKQVKDYAKSKGVLLKGDLPILVSRDSADVWAHPQFFKLDFAAGAPPDMYCAKGQRWGMPTYNWERIAADDYLYLKEKLRYAQNFYDILRIDHVVGLFRIWSIPYNEPKENQGLNGVFDPQDERLWAPQGREILSVILNNTAMLVCAEDLGVIPAACTRALEEFGIPGNDVARWVKDWKARHDFLPPGEYRELSVAMLSTHDTTNWPAWWEYEAGTVDEGLFIRKCNQRGIDYPRVKEALFDPARSQYGRLRWKEEIDSPGKMVYILGKPKEEAGDFVDLYVNSYREKEKLWQQMKICGPMREKCDEEILSEALRLTLACRAVFCIQSVIDWLFLSDIFKGDPYQYRINTPGTAKDTNWSLIVPKPLDDLRMSRLSEKMRALISASGR